MCLKRGVSLILGHGVVPVYQSIGTLQWMFPKALPWIVPRLLPTLKIDIRSAQ